MDNQPTDPALDLYRSIMTPWRDDPKIKAEFGNFGAWSAHQERQFAAKHGLTVAQVNELYPNHEAEADKMIEAGAPIGTAKADAVRYADDWKGSAAIRSEFRRFEVYCAYMRGKSRIAGRGTK